MAAELQTVSSATSLVGDHKFYEASNEDLARQGPIVAKLQQAFGYIQQAADGKDADSAKLEVKANGPSGPFHIGLHLRWQADEQAAVLVFLSHSFNFKQQTDSRPELVDIPWLSPYVPKAQAYGPFVEALSALAEEGGHTTLTGAVLNLSGGVKPRRVVCTGHCIGGALATLAAPFLATTFPASDMRCISFGSPRVGNEAFAKALYWLCQYSYRVVTPTDKVPPLLLPEKPLVHCRTEVVLGEEDFVQATLKRRCSPDPPQLAPDASNSLETLSHYANGLSKAQLTPSAVKTSIIDKALAALTPEMLYAPAPGVDRKAGARSDALWDAATHGATADVPSEASSASLTTQSVQSGVWELSDSEAAAEAALAAAVEQQLNVAGNVDVLAGRESAGLWAASQEDSGAPGSVLNGSGPVAADGVGEDEAAESFEPGELLHRLEEEWEGDTADTDSTAGANMEEREDTAANSEQSMDSGAGEQSLGMLVLRWKVWQSLFTAKAAYYQDSKRFARCAGVNPDSTRLLKDKKFDANVWIAWHAGTLVVTSRGTVSLTGIIQDLRFLSRQMDFLPYCPGARAHMGILDMCLSLTVGSDSKVMTAIKEVVPAGQQPTRVLVTGHSLGAGIAQLMSIWASLRFPLADVRTVTFGAPRLGNKQYREAFALLCGSSIRVVNRRDPLINLPPSVRGSHYVHVDNMLYIHKGGAKFGGRPRALEAQPNNFDHYAYAYIRAMSQLLPLPRGLSDLDEECPTCSPREFAQQQKAEKQAAGASGRGAGKSKLLQQVTEAGRTAVTVPIYAAKGVSNAVGGIASNVARAFQGSGSKKDKAPGASSGSPKCADQAS